MVGEAPGIKVTSLLSSLKSLDTEIVLQNVGDIKGLLFELRDLLSKALPDDLLEDDVQSIPSSRESSSLSSCSPELSPRQSPTTEDQHHWLYKPDAYHQASTPHIWGGAPPLKTPAGVAGGHGVHQVGPVTNGHGVHQFGPATNGHADPGHSSENHTPDNSQDWHFEHHHNRLQIPEPHNKYGQGLSPTTAAWDAARQQTAYGDKHRSDLDLSEHEDSQHYGGEDEQGNHINGVYPPEDAGSLHHGMHVPKGLDFVGNGHGEGGEDSNFYLQDHHSSGDEEEEPFTGERRYSQQYEPPKSAKAKPLTNGQATGWQDLDHFPPRLEDGRVMRHASSEPNVGIVHYQRRREHDGDEARNDTRRIMSDQMMNGDDHYQHSVDPYQTEFTHAGSRGQDVAQLEILYQARGREINNLTSQLEALREESAREKRILNHQLAMAQDERDGLGTTYGETQKLMNQMNNENHTLRGQLQSVQQQVQSLTEVNQQLHSELDTAKANIESLNHQLFEVQRSQPLHRAREQHDSLLVGLQQKFSQETANLREKVDAASKLASERGTLVDQLEARLNTSLKGADQARMEHAETVNRLTASLQDSQNRCQELILQGSLPAVQELQVRLNDASKSKVMAENMCQTLQEELADLKDQVMLYEGAVDLGVISGSGVKHHSPPTPSDEDIVRNLAKEDWKTPQPAGSQRNLKEPMSPEETLVKLKAELSRSLQSIRSKREHVTKLQVELREAKMEGQKWRGRVEGAEARVGQVEAELQILKKTLSENSTKETDAHKEYLERLKSELEAKTAAYQEQVEKLAVLKAEMAQMVADSDQDKKEAVDRCQMTCLQLHEDASRNMREELVNELQTEKETRVEAHQYQLQEVRNEMAELENELHKTKALYVELCDEKKSLEENMEKQISALKEESLQQTKAEMEREKTSAFDELKSSMEASHRAEIVLLLEKKKKENEEDLEKIKLDQDEADHLSSMASELKDIQQRYKELSASLTSQVNSEVEKAKEHWMRQENSRRKSFDRVAASTIEQMKANHAVELAEWQAKFTDEELQVKERIAAAVKEAKESWKKWEEKRRRESLEKKSNEGKVQETRVEKELLVLQQQLQKIQEALSVSQRDGKQVRAKYTQLKGRHDQEVMGLKQELRSCQTKLQQAERTVQQELEQLQTEMREANSVTMESMQERVSAIQQKHSLVLEKMKSGWEEERQKWKREKMQTQKDVNSISVQTSSNDESAIIEELKMHYMKSVENVRASAMSYVTDMQKRCQETLRTAVFEERQRVAAKMRKFYTKQVHSLRDVPRENKRTETSNHSPDQPPADQTRSLPMSRCRVSSLSTPQTLTSDLRPQSQANYIPSSRVSRRVHSDETPRSTFRNSSSVHPVAEMRKAQHPQNSQVPRDEHRDTRLQEQRGFARGDQVGKETMTGNHVVQQGEVASMGDKKKTAHGFHHFTEDDIGPNSVALLKDGDTNFSRTESTSIAGRNSKSPPVKKQLQQHSNITARRRSDGKKDHSLTQEMPLKVPARKTELPSNGPPQVLPSNRTTSQGTTMLRYALVEQDTHHFTKSWVNTHSEPPPQGIMLPTDANLSFESEYAELPQSLHESRVPSSLPNHPFLEESFSKNVPLPRRLVELQHGLSQSHPVRDSSRQDVYHVQASTGGQLRQGSTITTSKVVTKDIHTVNEDSGINSPFFVQP
ncbi:centrosomal protein of 152 kDa isoform X3 [Strongylocentrotus purpuratus]|uniref:CEP152 CEP63 binding coiled coil domain-containing protein n=1 Tax=Strongylocentrotus purpuratus TaxID=7668 RepID=A0A7M7PVU5_STRPU|nr:centrosomal protein of 152 kDa isoform X3 [Strongylocentrotus purpuratus]